MKISKSILLLALLGISIAGCDAIFDSKEDATTDEIFEVGKQDPKAATDVVGYAALLPFWDGFDNPTDIFIGYDELVYVTDNEGLHVLDLAGRVYRTIPLQNASDVTQDRKLNIYVAARYDTVIKAVDSTYAWNLPAVFKIKNANGAGDLQFSDTLVYPFADASRNTFASKTVRLDTTRNDNYEKVEVTGLTCLADNNLYVSRVGPSNATNAIEAPDNIVLEYRPQVVGGEETEQMQNIRQIRTLSPTTPSLISGVGISDISSFIGPPQRPSKSDSRSFLLAQASQNQNIPFRVLWINAVFTTDGLVFQPNTTLLQTDTASANGFLYEQNKFQEPTGIAYASDGTNYIFVVDAGTDSLYQFQSNGHEGVNPPAGSSAEKPIIVSFGGEGSGPKNFNDPSGVTYFDQIVYVADKGNNRIARYKLTTDFE